MHAAAFYASVAYMIITCPQCATSYSIPDGSVGSAGRRVRCSNCSHRWYIEPEPEPEPTPEDEALLEPAIDAIDSDFAVPPEDRFETEEEGRPSTRLSVVLGWCFLLMVVVATAGFIIGRHQVVNLAPETAPVYTALGLDVAREQPLLIEEVQSREVTEDDGQVIVVTGKIVNGTESGHIVPPVRVALLNDEREELLHDFVTAQTERLEQDETTAFEARFANPPQDARFFSVLLTPEGE